MKRLIDQYLMSWKDQIGRKPLLVRGGRQVGKSYAIEAFGREHFPHYVTVNLEARSEYHQSFASLDPIKIIASLAVLCQQATIDIFKKITGTTKQLFLVMISANGIKKNKYSEEILNGVVILNDLFIKESYA